MKKFFSGIVDKLADVFGAFMHFFKREFKFRIVYNTTVRGWNIQVDEGGMGGWVTFSERVNDNDADSQFKSQKFQTYEAALSYAYGIGLHRAYILVTTTKAKPMTPEEALSAASDTTLRGYGSTSTVSSFPSSRFPASAGLGYAGQAARQTEKSNV